MNHGKLGGTRKWNGKNFGEDDSSVFSVNSVVENPTVEIVVPLARPLSGSVAHV